MLRIFVARPAGEPCAEADGANSRHRLSQQTEPVVEDLALNHVAEEDHREHGDLSSASNT